MSPDLLDVTPPTARVSGTPGTMTVRQRACRSVPMAEVRRRIVDVAVQEWAFFGFPIRGPARAFETGAFASCAACRGVKKGERER